MRHRRISMLAALAWACLPAGGCAPPQRVTVVPIFPAAGAALLAGVVEEASAEDEASERAKGVKGVKGAEAAAGGDSDGASGNGLRPIPEIMPTREEALKHAREAAVKPPPSDDHVPAEAPQEPIEVLEVVLDDFEGELLWSSVEWKNANECQVALSQGEDGGALLLMCAAGREEKAGAKLSFAPARDLSRRPALALEVTVQGREAAAVAMGLQTSAYFEAPRKEVEAGQKTALTFLLTGEDFKTAPRWEHDSPLKGLSEVRTLFLLVYSDGERTVRIDNVRLLDQ